MKRNLYTFALLVLSLTAGRAPAVEVTGQAHIDYQIEGVTHYPCCDGVASYQLQYAPPLLHVDSLAILNHAGNPVWSAGGFDVTAGLGAGLQFSQSQNWLTVEGFPGIETEIDPDNGFGYHEFGPATIGLPGAPVSTPEPGSLLLALGGLLGLSLRPLR